jgi:hypothetical protein
METRLLEIASEPDRGIVTARVGSKRQGCKANPYYQRGSKDKELDQQEEGARAGAGLDIDLPTQGEAVVP